MEGWRLGHTVASLRDFSPWVLALRDTSVNCCGNRRCTQDTAWPISWDPEQVTPRCSQLPSHYVRNKHCLFGAAVWGRYTALTGDKSMSGPRGEEDGGPPPRSTSPAGHLGEQSSCRVAATSAEGPGTASPGSLPPTKDRFLPLGSAGGGPAHRRSSSVMVPRGSASTLFPQNLSFG